MKPRRSRCKTQSLTTHQEEDEEGKVQIEVIELGITMMSLWAVLLLLQTSVILYLVANTATRVHEEAMAGFGSLRWAYLRHMTQEEERNVQTLLTSFSGPPIMLTGGKLFGIHRPFILTIFGVIVTYFVVLY